VSRYTGQDNYFGKTMTVLSLKDPEVMHLRFRHPAFRSASKKMLGRGQFGAAFAMSDPTRVLKLTTDSKNVGYLTERLGPQGIHKPAVLANYGQVGESATGLPLYLLEMERLYPVRRGTPNGLMARRITRYVSKHDRFPEEDEELAGMTPELARFMCMLNWFWMNHQCTADANFSNFMERADGTLVFSDPVFDHKLWKKHG